MTPYQKVIHTLERLKKEGVIAEYDTHFYSENQSQKKGHIRIKYKSVTNEVDLRIYINSSFTYKNQQRKFGWVTVQILNSTKIDTLYSEFKSKIEARVITAIFERRFYELSIEMKNEGIIKDVKEASFEEDVLSRYDFIFTLNSDEKRYVDVTFNIEKPKEKEVKGKTIKILRFKNGTTDEAIKRRIMKNIVNTAK